MRLDSIVWEWPDRRGLEHLQLWTFADGMKADGLIVVDGEDGLFACDIRYSFNRKAGCGDVGFLCRSEQSRSRYGFHLSLMVVGWSMVCLVGIFAVASHSISWIHLSRRHRS
jgi:hypothetical protein